MCTFSRSMIINYQGRFDDLIKMNELHSPGLFKYIIHFVDLHFFLFNMFLLFCLNC